MYYILILASSEETLFYCFIVFSFDILMQKDNIFTFALVIYFNACG